jgi:hypothetical protein
MIKRLMRVFLVTMGVVILVLSLGVTVAAAGNGTFNGESNGNIDKAGQYNCAGDCQQFGDCTGTCDGSLQKNGWQKFMGKGTGQQSGNCTCTTSPVEITPLSETEIKWLTNMREEEKLARDVYLAFFEKYSLRVFKNIAASEQKHMDAIKTLLDRYQITDPALAEIGIFTPDSGLQAVYDKLTADGSVSLVEALKAGVFIEEMDIDDLEEAISATTHKDLIIVYNNLLQGSQNHLDAFNSVLAKQ